MQVDLIEILRCPQTGAGLKLEQPEMSGGRVRSGWLVTEDGRNRYPIRGFIPRFVPETNYADNFSMQWKRFRQTQLDSYSGVPISHDRFYRFSGWTAGDLAGKRVLDVGCGAGRFTEVALAAGAKVVAFDYSSACEACLENHQASPLLNVLQADIYKMPFAPGSFDYVYCLGVLQHTPDVRKAFLSLPRQLAAGGRIAVDIYPWLRRNLLWPKYWVRPITKRMKPEALFKVVRRLVPMLLPVSVGLGRIPVVGRQLRHVIPIANYDGVLPLSAAQVRDWAVLDTFDMLSPTYDQPQRAETLREWCREGGLEDIDVRRMGFLVGRGRRPAAS